MGRSGKGARRVAKSNKSSQTSKLPEDDRIESEPTVDGDAAGNDSVQGAASEAVSQENVEDAVVVSDPGQDDAPRVEDRDAPEETDAPDAKVSSAEDATLTSDATEEDSTVTDGADTVPAGDATADTKDAVASQPEDVLVPAPIVQPRISRGPGFLTLLLGGVLAGGIGFALAHYEVLTPNTNDGVDPIAQLSERVDQQASRMDELETQASDAADQAAQAMQAASAAATQDDLTALREEIAATETAAPEVPSAAQGQAPDLSGVTDRLDDLGARITALENAPVPETIAPDALAAYEQQLAALQGELESQRAAIADASAAAEDARSAATDETRRISVQASLAEIGAAIENGTPYVDLMAKLEDGGDISIPEGLSASASSGVATLSALQDSFPAAAREALRLSIRETSGGGAMDRLGAFLRSQTGARSLDAREGDDPDAILSRAEAAVKTGDLGSALTEIATLPEAGQAAMADWSTDARARLVALASLDDLSATLNTN